MKNYKPELTKDTLSILCEEFKKNNYIDPEDNEKYQVKRGLRNPDGTGVLAGLTRICTVHGYIMSENERVPVDGKLIYRGIDVADIVNGCTADNRFSFEETCWLLLFGELPTKDQLEWFNQLISECRVLPPYFAEDMIIKAPSQDIMNKLARSVLALYSYDENPEELTLYNVLRQSIKLIAQLPIIMAYAYQVKRRQYNGESMYFHPVNKCQSTAEVILSTIRSDMKFTDEEAKLLDLCLTLHAEHGGGNNSTFTARVVTSSGTDTYSAISAAIGSLKGPKHGGANIKVIEMLEHFKTGIKNWEDEAEIYEYIKKVLRKEAGDGSGLIYGMGHAVYTLSDPRAVILKKKAKKLAEENGIGAEFRLLELVEKLTPAAFEEIRGNGKAISANVDMYSGLVYKALKIPQDVFTPLFAIARVSGWCAHRIEELMAGGRIIRPAYKAVSPSCGYTALDDR
ncbi:MAG: citrate synthase [Clostridiales bacterium 43-6]|mgnify:CR=1 FL=1|nr:MAG: citrate synthase [Clostridiales bacterium 43-6]